MDWRLQGFLTGWSVRDSTGKKVPVRFTYVPPTPGLADPDGKIEVFGFYYDDTEKQEQGRVFTR